MITHIHTTPVSAPAAAIHQKIHPFLSPPLQYVVAMCLLQDSQTILYSIDSPQRFQPPPPHRLALWLYFERTGKKLKRNSKPDQHQRGKIYFHLNFPCPRKSWLLTQLSMSSALRAPSSHCYTNSTRARIYIIRPAFFPPTEPSKNNTAVGYTFCCSIYTIKKRKNTPTVHLMVNITTMGMKGYKWKLQN